MKLTPKFLSARTGKWVLAIAQILFLVVGISFIASSVVGEISGTGNETSYVPNTASFALSVVFSFLALIFMLISWFSLSFQRMKELGSVEEAYVFGVGQLGKYIPGGIWSVVGHGLAGGRFRNSRNSTVTSIELILVYSGSGLVVGSLFNLLYLKTPAIFLPSLLFGLLLTFFKVPSTILSRYSSIDFVQGRGEHLVSRLRALAFSLGFWLFSCLSLLSLLEDPSNIIDKFVEIITAYPIAHSLGMLFIFAPAGIGVREAVFLFVSPVSLQMSGASAFIGYFRISTIVADILFAATVLMISFFPKLGNHKEPE